MTLFFLGHMNFKGMPFSQDKIPSYLTHQYHKSKLEGEGKPQMPKREKEGGSQQDRKNQQKSVRSSYKLGT